MSAERSRTTLAVRRLEDADRASRLWRETDCLQVAVVELEDIGVGYVPARLLERVGNRSTVYLTDIGKQRDEAIGQFGRIQLDHISRDRRRARRHEAEGTSKWRNYGQQCKEENDKHNVLRPSEYSRQY